MRVTLKLETNHINEHYYGDLLCSTGIREYVELPRRGVSPIDVVFTKTRRSGSFKIVDKQTISNVLVGVDDYLIKDARVLVRKAYLAGYRYVHIEY